MAVFSVSSLAISMFLGVLFHRFILYPAFLSPLSKVPLAHPLASITPAWITWIRFRLRENTTILDAHERLGPVVRLGPNEVSVNCYQGGLKPVYSASFEKHDFYPRLFTNYGGVLNIFTTKQNKPHSARKRLVTHVYAKSYLQSSPSIAAQSQHIIYNRILAKLHGVVSSDSSTMENLPITMTSPNASSTMPKSGTMDVYPFFCGITMDFVTAYLFGLARSSNFIEDEKTCMWWCHSFVDRKPWTFWYAELPVLSDWLQKFGLLPIPKWIGEANKALDDWALKMCDSTRQFLSDHTSEKREVRPENEPVVYKQFAEAMAVTRPPPDAEQLRMDVASEMHDHLAAGDETSLITLVYLFYELSNHLEIQAALRAEIATLQPAIRILSRTPSSDKKNESSLPPLPSPKDIDALPILHAIFMETLRLHAPIPGPQPRVTPAGGCMLGSPAGDDTIESSHHVRTGQFFIPADVRVSASAYALHRVASVFPEPERFLPGRWLPGFSHDVNSDSALSSQLNNAPAPSPEDEARFREMNRYFWAFSSGGHMCLGNNFATQTIKLVVAAIVSNFRIEAVEKEGGGRLVLEQEDAWSAQPMEKKLVLRLVEVERS